VRKFSDLGVSKIEQKCNEVRQNLLAKWKVETGSTINGTDIKRETAILEAEPEFKLRAPEKVDIEMLDKNVESYKSSKYVQLTECENDKATEFKIVTLMRWVKKKNGQFFVFDPGTGRELMPLVDSTIHELLHAYGDLPPRVHDGVVRQTWIGITAVKPLLEVK
jgi:hypothetical protein